MMAEAEFLVAALRHFLDPKSTLPDTGKIRWNVLFDLASAHAVMPMLYAALREVPLPDDIGAELRTRFQSSVQWSLAQSAELARLTALLEESEITSIALKGPLLSRYLYGELGARSSGDIDLLVKPGDLLRIRDLLLSRGYRVANTLHWNSDSAYLRSRENEISFGSPSGVSIDVHWRILPRYFASPFDGLDVWSEPKTTRLAGRRVLTLGPEHLLLLISSHSAKHGFERLGWICDIARFLIVSGNLVWPAAVAQARRTRTLRQFFTGIRLAADLLRAPVPEALTEDPAAMHLADLVKERFLSGVTEPLRAGELTRFCLGLLETRQHRLRYLTGHYLTPSEAEYKVLRLPPSMYFLYYPFRPARLLTKHVLRGSITEHSC